MDSERKDHLVNTFLKLAEATDDAGIQEAAQAVGDVIKVGDIKNATGVAVGRNIRMIVNHFDLPANTVAELLNARSMLAGLDPNRYQLETLLVDKTREFVGREYVFEAIERFLINQPQGYFIIEGDPGLGKSTIMAELVRRTGYVSHFNVRALGIVAAQQFLENVCTQLIVDYGLPYISLPENATRDSAFLERLLSEASAKLASEENLVIVVDALDEVDLTSHYGGANILYLPTVLPDNVYFILSKRQKALPFVTQAPQHIFDLMQYTTENREDVERYLQHNADRPQIRAWIDRQGMSAIVFVTKLVDLSESNFMYLRYVLPEIEQGTYQSLRIENLPAGLEGYYEDHWRRMGMMARPLPRVKIRIVYILSEVRQPVSRRLITGFANSPSMQVSEVDVQEVLDEWDEFLREQPTPEGTKYSVYHSSFQDFLGRKDIVQAAGVSIKEINALIADDLWRDLFGNTQ